VSSSTTANDSAIRSGASTTTVSTGTRRPTPGHYSRIRVH
jgi:hypothetical protein